MKGNSPLENVAQKIDRSWGGEIQNVSVLVAIGVNSEGYREILGVAEGSRENKESWSNFLRYLKESGAAQYTGDHPFPVSKKDEI